MTNPKVIEDMADLKRRMQGALEMLKKEFSGLRTGRASQNLLDPVQVEAYGSRMHLSQLGTVGVPEPRLLTVQVWDKSMVKAVEKGIRDAGLGLNPMADGQLIRVPIPDLSQERRQELIKIASKYAELARVSVRNVRRDGMDHLKGLLKESVLSEDDHHHMGEDIQKITDEFVKKIDESFHEKEKEILHI
ncbi:MAG: ribosome recycling factor [Alphaproteobacteria bacterium 16-39-46]|nr:MAG: ribosome recycling factor [Alphaproteobacteria bacterium 16-39-46]OZA41770.1 MAG: ribosome recycling factor [Alphaproteobacteria bacterium 17-39-52]HQS84707.1 ribosome recycling factor [Alphaproteobacteria bacterium]HQS94528.1 ribosome recycling factor [Alphaproteobacteria bacterium]